MSTAIEFLNHQLQKLVFAETEALEAAAHYEDYASKQREKAAKAAEQAASVRDAIELLTPKGPRVWERYEDLPPGVAVLDSDGDKYRKSPDGEYLQVWDLYETKNWAHSIFSGHEFDQWAPFTEILEGEE